MDNREKAIVAESVICQLQYRGAKVDDALDILSVVTSSIIHTYFGKLEFQRRAAQRFAHSIYIHIKKLNLDFYPPQKITNRN